MDKSFRYISNHSSTSKYIYLSSLAVFAGGFIYILFRPTEPVFFSWFSAIGIENWLYSIREKSISISSFLPQWIVYSLTNGLWAFAYTLIVLSIWTGSKSFLKYFWFLSIPVLVFGFEVLQLTGEIQGTFCLNDIIWSAIGITTGFITTRIITSQNRYKISQDNHTSDHITH
ncbi:MAG: hypothetical protein ABFS38_18735 [Bacteroidota bacterium]